MIGLSDRISGTFFLILGLTMYLFVNPNYIETVDGGNISPSTFPNVVSIVIAVCGAMLLFRPTPHQSPEIRSVVITSTYVLLLVVGLYVMSRLGFEYIAPVLALIIMLAIGERRPLWLVVGAIVIPVLIWFLVTIALGRALP
ncbi:MAG: tripartite tricarboxylate transporter TctB family protein [Granulosicoccaceae bacterium]